MKRKSVKEIVFNIETFEGFTHYNDREKTSAKSLRTLSDKLNSLTYKIEKLWLFQ